MNTKMLSLGLHSQLDWTNSILAVLMGHCAHGTATLVCCVNLKNLGVEITSLIGEGPWVFAGVKDGVKAWNVQTDSEFTLDGPKGQVLSMIVGNDTLLAGAEMIIYAWRGSSDPKAKFPFQLAHALPREWINLEPLLLLRGCKHPRYHALHRFRFSFEVIQVASI